MSTRPGDRRSTPQSGESQGANLTSGFVRGEYFGVNRRSLLNAGVPRSGSQCDLSRANGHLPHLRRFAAGEARIPSPSMASSQEAPGGNPKWAAHTPIAISTELSMCRRGTIGLPRADTRGSQICFASTPADLTAVPRDACTQRSTRDPSTEISKWGSESPSPACQSAICAVSQTLTT